jgi:hypothetical protein
LSLKPLLPIRALITPNFDRHPPLVRSNVSREATLVP